MANLIVIAGPTASGKTSLSLALAKAFDAEIISADARQFYRGLDIGTAKPTPQEQSDVPHHFIDILDPDEAYNAGTFERDVLSFLESYFERKNTAILVGGSGLYIKAVLEGFDDLPSTPAELRARFNARLEKEGLSSLQQELKERDPEYAAEVDLENPQRILRALEAIEITGIPFSTLRNKSTAQRPFDVHGVLLFPDREVLYQRIEERVDRMVELGLEEEARRLYPLKDHNALQTVGYREWFAYFDGFGTRDDAILKIKQHTRNYAKRQYTWFKNQEGFASFTTWTEDEVIRHLRERMNV